MHETAWGARDGACADAKRTRLRQDPRCMAMFFGTRSLTRENNKKTGWRTRLGDNFLPKMPDGMFVERSPRSPRRVATARSRFCPKVATWLAGTACSEACLALHLRVKESSMSRAFIATGDGTPLSWSQPARSRGKNNSGIFFFCPACSGSVLHIIIIGHTPDA